MQSLLLEEPLQIYRFDVSLNFLTVYMVINAELGKFLKIESCPLKYIGVSILYMDMNMDKNMDADKELVIDIDMDMDRDLGTDTK